MNSTLQKFADLEAKVSALETVMNNMAITQAEISSVKSDVQKLAEALTKFANNSKLKFNGVEEYLQLTAQRTISLEESLASLSKMLLATVEELSETKLVSQKSVLTRIRLADEAAEKEQISQRVQLGVLKEASESTSQSTLVVSQTLQKPDGTIETIAEYRVIEMQSPMNGDSVVERFVGKKIGDSVEYNSEGSLLLTKIEKIYEFAEVSKSGEESESKAAN